jgi:hypothetical protein
MLPPRARARAALSSHLRMHCTIRAGSRTATAVPASARPSTWRIRRAQRLTSRRASVPGANHNLGQRGGGWRTRKRVARGNWYPRSDGSWSQMQQPQPNTGTRQPAATGFGALENEAHARNWGSQRAGQLGAAPFTNRSAPSPTAHRPSRTAASPTAAGHSPAAEEASRPQAAVSAAAAVSSTTGEIAVGGRRIGFLKPPCPCLFGVFSVSSAVSRTRSVASLRPPVNPDTQSPCHPPTRPDSAPHLPRTRLRPCNNPDGRRTRRDIRSSRRWG